MKVISGKYKGINLDGNNIDGTRPTMDRVKESLFAMLQFKIKDKIILDLFAGSASLGIEALSMGARKVYFVDNNKKAIKCINNNINKLKIDNKYYEVLLNDFKKSLIFLKNKTFDIIFLDPPYKTNYIEESIKLILEYNILNKNAILVCETDDVSKIPVNSILKEIKVKKYGDKYIVILEKV